MCRTRKQRWCDFDNWDLSSHRQFANSNSKYLFALSITWSNGLSFKFKSVNEDKYSNVLSDSSVILQPTSSRVSKSVTFNNGLLFFMIFKLCESTSLANFCVLENSSPFNAFNLFAVKSIVSNSSKCVNDWNWMDEFWLIHKNKEPNQSSHRLINYWFDFIVCQQQCPQRCILF